MLKKLMILPAIALCMGFVGISSDASAALEKKLNAMDVVQQCIDDGVIPHCAGATGTVSHPTKPKCFAIMIDPGSVNTDIKATAGVIYVCLNPDVCKGKGNGDKVNVSQGGQGGHACVVCTNGKPGPVQSGAACK